jgi:hypothetical protein
MYAVLVSYNGIISIVEYGQWGRNVKWGVETNAKVTTTIIPRPHFSSFQGTQ